MTEIMESVAGNLQQRIGELVSRYEVDLAILRANASKQLEEKEAEIASLKEQLEAVALDAQGRKAPDVQEEAPPAAEPSTESS